MRWTIFALFLGLVGCSTGVPCGTNASCVAGEEFCVEAGVPEGLCLPAPACMTGGCGDPDASCLMTPAIEAGAACEVIDGVSSMTCVGENDGSDGSDVQEVASIICLE